ncbi:hypothetical protein R5H32_00060 [Defluviimonas sp. D31]|uniref:hypothetical protein n=1 Tax=Defluviimonas sp. D31 TaxID=3083253 RepID=UPI00296EA105|nr:hypothetical protein [Defluviimonas sp. D31]MDW4547738.1 hypothetical protein [Defluviimonas sp. D31]
MSATATPVNNIFLLNRRVIDPETGLDAIRNVAVDDGRTVAISKFALETGVVVDASGKVLDPAIIAEKANCDEPIQPAVGARTLLVIGGFVVREENSSSMPQMAGRSAMKS